MRWWCVGCCALTFLAALLIGCRKAPDAEKEAAAADWFADVTEAAGLDFVHDPGPVNDGRFFMPQSVGSGAALLDIDGDGLLDIYLLNDGGPKGKPNQLYRQKPDGTFENVSKGSGLDFSGHCMGVAVGDVNNDGRPDVLVTLFGGARLFLNNGNGTFTDITAKSGIENPLWGSSACFFDFDRDGWLDLVIVNYVNYDQSFPPCPDPSGKPDYCGPMQFAGVATRLFRNLGGAGQVKFEDVTLRSGLGKRPGPGLGVVCADFTGDGWPDIFVANDTKPNHLWVNQKNGTFTEEAVIRGLAGNANGENMANMGVALGDVDGDGEMDLFATHLTEQLHTLWKQGPRGTFTDRTGAAGLARPKWRGTGFGTVLADFDNDGALDLAVVNGRIVRGKEAVGHGPGDPFWRAYAQRNQLFRNDGKGVFEDVSLQNPAFCQAAHVSRGLVMGDVDNDGGVDLLVTNTDGPARLFRNVASGRGHWLIVRAIDPQRRGDALGAVVRVQSGSRRWVRLVSPAQSFLSSNDPRAHFGLGEAARIDAITAEWPDGSHESFSGGAVDGMITLRKGSGKKVAR